MSTQSVTAIIRQLHTNLISSHAHTHFVCSTCECEVKSFKRFCLPTDVRMENDSTTRNPISHIQSLPYGFMDSKLKTNYYFYKSRAFPCSPPTFSSTLAPVVVWCVCVFRVDCTFLSFDGRKREGKRESVSNVWFVFNFCVNHFTICSPVGAHKIYLWTLTSNKIKREFSYLECKLSDAVIGNVFTSGGG